MGIFHRHTYQTHTIVTRYVPLGLHYSKYLFWLYAYFDNTGPIQPERDGSLENDIITHENTHGMTNRMVGGGTAACLQTLESGGLGEGMSKFLYHRMSLIRA